MILQKIAMLGLGPMGTALARNMRDKGKQVSGYDLEERARNRAAFYGIPIIRGLSDIEDFEGVFVMVPESRVDDALNTLKGRLPSGKIIVEGGNSHFSDTERRARWALDEGFRYLGTGISGGEEGALKGPCIMPGGNIDVYNDVKPLLKDIAAKAHGKPCVAYMGPGGAGHFVKTVHNGIEYAIMQAIGETYHLLLHSYGLDQTASFFRRMKEDPEAGGFLIEITDEILNTRDPTNQNRLLVEAILDRAGQKGTGKWASQIAYDLGVPVPSISAALNARIMSSYKELRKEAVAKIARNPPRDRKTTASPHDCLDALTCAMICAYNQGFHMLYQGSKEHSYALPLNEIARIWQGGCIIRSPMMGIAEKAFEKNPDDQLIFSMDTQHLIGGLIRTIGAANEMGIPTPVLSATKDYCYSLCSETLPGIQLIQAQRDHFGAHTYKRSDREGTYHMQWSGSGRGEEKKIP